MTMNGLTSLRSKGQRIAFLCAHLRIAGCLSGEGHGDHLRADLSLDRRSWLLSLVDAITLVRERGIKNSKVHRLTLDKRREGREQEAPALVACRRSWPGLERPGSLTVQSGTDCDDRTAPALNRLGAR